jgi:tetratricopeptide (TPR) repeat protein
MSSIIPDYEYDIFISYRQKDNKYDGWVTEFVDHLKRELEATFKEDLSIYTDDNPHDGLLETHNVDKSLEAKLKCLVFIPVISQTYCDPKSFAWQHEFCEFNKMAKFDPVGRDIKLSNGNVASRILPVKIHDLDIEDNTLLENELGGVLRAVDFIYKESGVNRPLKPTDNKNDNQNKTDYRNQINKVANGIKEIIDSLKRPSSTNSKPAGHPFPERKPMERTLRKIGKRSKMLFVIFSLIMFTALALFLYKLYFSEEGSKVEYNKKITTNPKAYEWYMKAEFRLTPENSDDLDSCIFFLTKAIDDDSLFALAHAELSRAYSFKNYFIDPNGGYSEKAFVESEKSLFLNPNLAEGYFARAYCTWNFQNKFPHEKVIREYKKAIVLNPDMDEAYHQLSVVYAHVGLMQESFDAIKKAVQINPNNKYASIDLIRAYLYPWKKSDLEHMIDLYKQTPEHLLTSFRVSFWAIALIDLDRSDEAKNIILAGIKKDSSDLFYNSVLAILLAKEGDKTGALKKIELCEKSNLNTGHFHHVVYNLAVANALLGDYEKSVNKLNWVADNGFPNYLVFRDDPLLKSLQTFPAYNDLLKKLKISNEKFRKIANE